MSLVLRLIKGSRLTMAEGDANLQGLSNGSNWSTAVSTAAAVTLGSLTTNTVTATAVNVTALDAATADLSGNVSVGGLLNSVGTVVANVGVNFAGTQVSSSNVNTLDDYEEGTWTPAFTSGTPGDLSVTYSVQNGTYTKVGRLVTLTFRLVTSAFTWTTSTGNFQISGVPFASATFRFYGALSWSGVTKAGYTNIVARMGVGTSLVTFPASGSGVAVAVLAIADIPSAGTVDFEGTITYEAAT